MAVRSLMLIHLLSCCFSTTASAGNQLKAAFIRDHQLWMVEDGTETQLTKDKFVSSPKWSKDGQFIAYAASERDDEPKQLYIYDVKKKENYQPYPAEVNLFKWSPVSNQLAYTSRGVLNVTHTKDGRPHGFENVSLGVSDFEWFPNGKEIIASSQSNLLPTGWEPVRLFRIAADANLIRER